jgi:hypothetical protein
LAYHVQISREDLERLESFPYISAGKLADVLDEVQSYLGNVTDRVREDCRVGPGSPYFLFDYVFRDEGHGHQLLFYVDDSHATAGVLVVAFVDHRVGPSL